MIHGGILLVLCNHFCESREEFTETVTPLQKVE